VTAAEVTSFLVAATSRLGGKTQGREVRR